QLRTKTHGSPDRDRSDGDARVQRARWSLRFPPRGGRTMSMMTGTARILVAITLVGVPPASATAQQPVRIRSGMIMGARDGEVAISKGIPYAAPPVGELRWRPPQPAPHWDGVREATTFGLPCPQPRLGGPWPVTEWSEDCLTVNVWTPAATP